MAVFRGDIRSTALGMDTGLAVILPYDRPAGVQQTPCKVLYLLHGLGDNCAAWCRYTAIERYARDKGLAVIMPEVQRSFYHDMVHGPDYFTYVSEELPALCGAMFGISTRREDTYIAGLSMGGYGALKCGLTHPGRYAGCASFSGAVDLVGVMAEHSENEALSEEFKAVLGTGLQIRDGDNLMVLAEAVSRLPRAQQPAVYITCGTEDFLYEGNQRFKAHLETLPLDFTFVEWPGEHEWGFWDVSVAKALEFFLPEPV